MPAVSLIWKTNRAVSDVMWKRSINVNITKVERNRAFSLTWSASTLIYLNKRKHLQAKRVQLPEDFLGTVSLFSNTNMAAVTSCENAPYVSVVLTRDLHTKEVY